MSTFNRIALLLTLTVTTASLHAQAGVQIRSQDGMLSIQASNISAGEFAAELSQELGISVVVTGDSETQVNLDIVDEPLEKALGKLSPNHMLVRNQDASEITEVVLMMGEGKDGSSGANGEQFLPSGSPTDEIIDDQIQNASSEEILQDPSRANTVRESAATAVIRGNGARQELSMDPQNGLPPIDPVTGLPYE